MLVEFQLDAPDPGNPTPIPQKVLMEWQQQGLLATLGHINAMAPPLVDTDLMVLPRYREGAPRSSLEIAARGLPIIYRLMNTRSC